MPQPVDLQTELGRMTAAERIQQLASRASLAGQARIAEEEARRESLAQSSVNEAEAQSEQIDEELRRHNPFVGRRKRGSGEKSGQHLPQAHRGGLDGEEGSQLDVKV